MEIRYNVTGAKRKELVKVIADTTGATAKYLGMPSAAYEIDYFTVLRDGTLTFSDRADSEEVEQVLEAIAAAGFECELQEATETATEEEPKEIAEPAEESEQGESVGLTVALPIDEVNVGNLTNLLDAKGALIQKALEIEATPIEVGEDRVSFPWFSEVPDTDTCKAVTALIAALCKMSKEQKRISSVKKEVDNEKYAFRCFLLRLGFIGDEYKKERKILLRNLTGSSAFKNGVKAQTESEVADDEVSE